MNIDALINYILESSLIWLIITLSSFKLGIIVYKKFNKNIFLQPIIVAYVIIFNLVFLLEVPYTEYFKGVEIIHFFLGPATVALALPLYNNIKFIKSLFIPILITLISGGLLTIIISVSLLSLLDANITTILSMTTKSITAPIAIITAKQIDAIPSLAVGFVIITGILGTLFSTIIFKIMKIRNDISKGFALGLVSHGIGTARAIEISEKAAAFAALAMGLNGIFTVIFLLFIVNLIT